MTPDPEASLHRAMRQNLSRPHGFEPLAVEGTLPPDLRGTLYRTGPGVYERFNGRSVTHMFEADGVVSSVRLDGASAQGAARAVEGDGYRKETEAGRPLYTSAARWLDRAPRFYRGDIKNTGNTAMWSHQGRLFALMEAAVPIEIDPDTLATVAETNLGCIENAFSAHPHYVASRGASFGFGATFGPRMTVDVYALPDDGPARTIQSFTAPFSTFVHDFIVTDHHLVFMVCPAPMRLLRVLMQTRGMKEWFDWQPERGTEIIAIPIDDPSRITRFTTDAFWFWHVVNAWSEGSVVRAQIPRYPNLASYYDVGENMRDEDLPALYELTIDLERKTCRSELRADLTLEFPHVHPSVRGKQHRATYGVLGWAGSDGERGIARIDEHGEVVDHFTPGADHRVSEPVLVPRHRGGEEEDAYVLTLVHEATREQSYLAVLDAGALDAGPIAKAWFDQVIPETFHGAWIAS